jgi:hypothetical protein
MKALIGTFIFSALAVSQLSAGTVAMTFTGANGQEDSSGWLISPYTATVNGVSTTVYCDDFANEVSNGQTWTANVSLLSGSLANTRYGAITQTLSTSTGTASYNSAQLYDMAAYLTTQYSASGTAGYSSNGDIQDTIWDIFNPNSANPGVKPPAPSTEKWLYQAEANYGTINTNRFEILTNTNPTYSGAGQTQEFITMTPEPSSVLLLGVGLIGMSFVGQARA